MKQIITEKYIMVFAEETPLEFMESPRVHDKIFIKNVRKQTAAATLVSDLFQLTRSHYIVSFFARKTHKTPKPRFPNHRNPSPNTSLMIPSAFLRPLSHHQKRFVQTNAKVQATKVAAIKGTEERICLKWLGRKVGLGPFPSNGGKWK